jgi:hypothetical protein
MTWTYSLGQLNTAQLPQVRFLIGDTLPSDQLLQDEEINYALAARGNVYGAAADCCRSIASTFSRQADMSAGDLRISRSQKAKAYLEHALNLDVQFATSGGATPWAGGISVSDKQTREQDTDRVPPQFNIGMEDNHLPVGDSGNELQSNFGTR